MQYNYNKYNYNLQNDEISRGDNSTVSCIPKDKGAMAEENGETTMASRVARRIISLDPYERVHRDSLSSPLIYGRL